MKNFHKNINDDVIRLEKGNHRINNVLQEISHCIFAMTGIKKKDFIKSLFDELEYRKFCFEIVRHLNSKNFDNYEHRINSIRKLFREKFNTEIDDGNRIDVEKSLNELSRTTSLTLSQIPESCYSSIHRAKGLEATSVLVVAYSNNELKKWLNYHEADKNPDDDYRLGYVAFSRARDILCIACLEKICNETIKNLESLNIVFYPNEDTGASQKKLLDF